MKKIINFIFDFAILFGFLFEFHLIGESFTTRRIAAIIAFFYLLLHLTDVSLIYRQLSKKCIRRVIGAFVICSFLVLFCKDNLYYLHNSYFELWYFVNIFLYVIVFPVFCFIRFKNVKYLVWVLTAILIVQAVAVLMAYISTPVRLFLYEMFYDGDDRFEQDILRGSRIMGIALHSATGSVTCSAIALFFSYATLKKDLSFLWYILLCSVLLLTTLFIGRTGVLVEIIIVAFSFFYSPTKSIYKISILVPIVALFIYSLVAILNSSDSGTTEGFIRWMSGLFNENRTETINAINSDGFPEFSPEFVFGTGIMIGKTSSGIVLQSDSGFVRLYTSLGIVGGFLYYWAYYNIFTSMKPKKYSSRVISHFYFLIIILAYVIEYKEPFLLKYTFPFMIVLISLFISKDFIASEQPK